MLCFDIETKPASLDVLKANYQELTLADFIESCPSNWKHETKVEKYEAAKANHWAKYLEKAALSPISGEVLVVGVYSSSAGFIYVHGSEPETIAATWAVFDECHANDQWVVGVNIHGFDLPFLARRSWMLGVSVPRWIRSPGSRYWSSTFIDLCQEWLAGNRFGSEPCSFDTLARAFGTEGKQNGLTGDQFAELWATNQPAALEYLKADVCQPYEWAMCMGF